MSFFQGKIDGGYTIFFEVSPNRNCVHIDFITVHIHHVSNGKKYICVIDDKTHKDNLSGLEYGTTSLCELFDDWCEDEKIRENSRIDIDEKYMEFVIIYNPKYIAPIIMKFDMEKE